MRHNLRFLPALVLGAIITLSACADYAERVPYIPPTALNPAVQATVGARLGADANATWQAYTYSGTATAYAATRVVERVTEEAQAAATARQAAYQAQVAAVQLRSTEQALSLAARQTEVSLTAEQTRESVIVHATAQAARQKSEIAATANALEAQRQSIQRESEAAVVARQRQWNELYPWLIVTAVSVAVIAALVALAQWWRRNTPVRPMTEGMAMLVTDARHYAVAAPPMLSANPPEREQLALPVPRITTVDEPQVLRPIPTGHILIAGESGSGKTTAARHVLVDRQNVVVLDPHDDRNTWPDGAEVVGGGRAFRAIDERIAQLESALQDRYGRRNYGEKQFDPITVAVDEMPAIVEALGSRVNDVWRHWLREGRKVSLYFVVISQSTRVKTLGIEGEGDLLENFDATLVLGKLAIAEYPALARDMDRPAVIRTAEGVRPLVVPYPPPSPASRNTPLLVAPAPPGLETEWGHVTPSQVSLIITMDRLGESGRAIQRRVFDYEGGAAYHMVEAVRAHFCTGSSSNGALQTATASGSVG